MAQASLPESILVADCGAVATKVGLIDRVADEYRLIGVTRSMTTVEPPLGDIRVGVTRAIVELEDLTGRRLLSDGEDLLTPERAGGEGVDAFVAVTSAALPLRAAIVGLSRDLSVASAQRALASTYAVVDHTLAVDEESGRWGTTARDGRAGGPSVMVEKLAVAQLDLIVMVGGVDGGALTPLLELANIVAAMGAAMDASGSKRPLILFAGNREARALVAERIGSIMPIVSVENVRPQLDRENLAPLQNEITNIFHERKLKPLPGLEKLNAWSAQPVIPTSQAWAHVAQYLARKYALRVLAVDWGGATTTLVRADSGHVTQALAPDYGLGYGLMQLLDRIGMEGIARWLPPTTDLSDAHANLLNQALRPWTTPQRQDDFISLHAAAREALMLGAAPLLGRNGADEVDLLLLAGAPIARGSKPGALMLMALDALELRGIFSIAGDVTGIAAALGAVAAINPDAAAQVVESDALVTWGTAFVPTISSRAGEGVAMQLRCQLRQAPATGGEFQAEVKTGSLELIPLPLEEKAQIEVRPARGVDLGVPLSGGVFKREVQGGTVGLIIDARGRPVPRLDNLDRQRERVQQWMWEAGA